MTDPDDCLQFAAYGGPGWSARTTPLRAEIGSIWRACGVGNEWGPLREVLLHRPAAELAAVSDPNAVQMLARPDPVLVGQQHDALARAYREAGVDVHRLAPVGPPSPNLMFVADLVFMTPEGAILARPASTVRAGEERHVALRLADLGIPILRSLRHTATFEGADAAWLDNVTVLIARGQRTNAQGIAQLSALLHEMGVDVIEVALPPGAMHLMGLLRIVDRNLAIAWPGRTPAAALDALRARGIEIAFLPDETEASQGMALNFVTLGPRAIVMPAGNPRTQAFYEGHGIACTTVAVDELIKAAGAIGCLTGVLRRETEGR